jgi:hypothetical protein
MKTKKMQKPQRHEVYKTAILRTLGKSLRQQGANDRDVLIEQFGAAFTQGRFEFVDEICQEIYGGNNVDAMANLEVFGDVFLGTALPPSMKAGTYCTFVLLGVLDHNENHNVSKLENMGAIEKAVAKQFRVEPSEVSACPMIAQPYVEYERGMRFERYIQAYRSVLIADGVVKAEAMPDLNVKATNATPDAEEAGVKVNIQSTPAAVYVSVHFEEASEPSLMELASLLESIGEGFEDHFPVDYKIEGQNFKAGFTLLKAGLPGSIFAEEGYYIEAIELSIALEEAMENFGGMDSLSLTVVPQTDGELSYCEISIHQKDGTLIEEYETRRVMDIAALVKELEGIEKGKSQAKHRVFPAMHESLMVH